jgi:hypothetical protein
MKPEHNFRHLSRHALLAPQDDGSEAAAPEWKCHWLNRDRWAGEVIKIITRRFFLIEAVQRPQNEIWIYRRGPRRAACCWPRRHRRVKIGVLNDQSGGYADNGGKFSVEAAKMAIEDIGGEVLD